MICSYPARVTVTPGKRNACRHGNMPPMSHPIRQVLREAQQALEAALRLPASDVRTDAQLLMRRALGDVSRAWLIAHDNERLDPVQAAAFDAMLQRRALGEPVAYILAEREFYGLGLRVTPEVLIPRPDTETLVEAALARIPENVSCRVLDLGTGSGAIAIAIAAHRPLAKVTGVDRSPGAVQLATENAHRHPLKNASFAESDWFSALKAEKFDCIVSNPPYIAADDPHLSQGDLRFEPITALASGQDGLDDIRRLVQDAPEHLATGGWLLLEHGYGQAQPVSALMAQAGFIAIETLQDLAGIGRVTLGRAK